MKDSENYEEQLERLEQRKKELQEGFFKSVCRDLCYIFGFYFTVTLGLPLVLRYFFGD